MLFGEIIKNHYLKWIQEEFYNCQQLDFYEVIVESVIPAQQIRTHVYRHLIQHVHTGIYYRHFSFFVFFVGLTYLNPQHRLF